jgi:hypothetical protein
MVEPSLLLLALALDLAFEEDDYSFFRRPSIGPDVVLKRQMLAT